MPLSEDDSGARPPPPTAYANAWPQPSERRAHARVRPTRVVSGALASRPTFAPRVRSVSVQEWRRLFADPHLFFAYVQIAPYTTFIPDSESNFTALAELRFAQARPTDGCIQWQDHINTNQPSSVLLRSVSFGDLISVMILRGSIPCATGGGASAAQHCDGDGG